MLEGFFHRGLIEAGCDEAGRGCLAGPVFAAAVILPPGFCHPSLNDSKKMTQREREKLRPVIESEAVAWAVAQVSPQRIDTVNILNASFEAMCEAVVSLKVEPQMLLIDGNRFRSTLGIPYECIIGGDGKYACIAAASVLAKTHRDEYMREMAGRYPGYGWERNKGYPTREHRIAIGNRGVTPEHRRSFNHAIDQLSLFGREMTM